MHLGNFRQFNLMRLLVRHFISPVKDGGETHYTSGRTKTITAPLVTQEFGIGR